MRISVVLCALAACSGDLGPARPHPLPQPDNRAALLQPGAKSPRLASYRIDATFDPAQHTITATEHLTWKNNSGSPVSDLAFHLYMNAFKNDESTFMQESHGEMRGVAASPDHYGWIDVSSIKIGGEELRGRSTYHEPPDETRLDVPLTQPVPDGATLDVDLTFTTQLPEVFARTGFSGDFQMIGQWFPKIGVREGNAWTCDVFHANSEFYADFGVYDVKLTVPSTQVVAATGVLTDSADNGDGTYTLTYHAEDVHDFAWMSDPYMQMISGTAHTELGDVEVRVYARPDQADFAKRHLAAGIGTIETFSDLFVPYPWPIMTIIDPPPGADGASGMEYPTLVVTGGDGWYARDGIRLPEYVTIHEVGHNWFQGMLASNEGAEAWMDEGINEWADAEAIGKLYGEKSGAIDWMDFTVDVDRLRRLAQSMQDIPQPIATASWAFVDSEAYGAATYTKTLLALATLENLVGRDPFLAAMKSYAQQWAFKHPTGRDFFAAISTALDRNLDWFWEPVFRGTGTAELSVRSTECRPKGEPRGVFGDGEDRKVVLDDKATGTYACDVEIANTGTVRLPVYIDVHFADGTVQSLYWDNPGSETVHDFPIDRSSPITAVVIDPDGQILLTDDRLDDAVRLERDSRASLRAAARVTWWTQTAMQGIGL